MIIQKILSKPRCIFLTVVLLIAACSKDSIYQDIDHQKADYIIKANTGLNFYNQILKQTGFGEILKTSGPFTVFVPNDEAFKTDGYSLVDLVSSKNALWTDELTRYLVSDGNFRLEELPFAFNTAVRSKNGYNIYLSRWIPQNGDTTYTVNGATVIKSSIEANNGLVHILQQLPVVNRYHNLAERIAGTAELTLFSRALALSGLEDLLRKPGGYTVFAPSNEAMVAYGLSSLEEVSKANKADLENIVRRHILQDVYFRRDFRLLIAYSEQNVSVEVDYFDPTSKQLLNGLGATGNRGSFNAKMLSGASGVFTYAQGRSFWGSDFADMDRLSLTIGGVTAITRVDRKDMAADNGVVQMIDKVLPGN